MKGDWSEPVLLESDETFRTNGRVWQILTPFGGWVTMDSWPRCRSLQDVIVCLSAWNKDSVKVTDDSTYETLSLTFRVSKQEFLQAGERVFDYAIEMCRREWREKHREMTTTPQERFLEAISTSLERVEKNALV